MKAYCYYITTLESIAAKAQKTDRMKSGPEIFCASQFDSKEECLTFAQEIETMKYKANELNTLIYAGKRNGHFPWMFFK